MNKVNKLNAAVLLFALLNALWSLWTSREKEDSHYARG